MNRVALVVPCYNEEARLDVRALAEARLEGRRLDLLLVDDGSRDATRTLLDQVASRRAHTRVVSLERNSGKAEAVRRGVLDALTDTPDAVGFWDADLATPLSELPRFVEALEANPAVELVFGARVQLMGRVIERQLWRHYFGRVFATAASVALGLPVYDTQCGAKLFRTTPLLAEVFAKPFVARWVFDVEVVARYMALDPRGPAHIERSLLELPLERWTDVRGSKLRPRDFARAALDLATIRRLYGGGSRGSRE